MNQQANAYLDNIKMHIYILEWILRRHLSTDLAHNLIGAVNSHGKSSTNWRYWNFGSVVEFMSQGLHDSKVFE